MGTAVAPLSESVPAYVADRIRQQPPDGCSVLPGSTPVVSFGDPRRSRVATLGLNPSRTEFEERGDELIGPRRRFETVGSLGLASLDDLSDDAVTRIHQRCKGYFHGNPYRWFNDLERILNAVGASYFADTACHLDLSPLATDPTWNRLSRRARDRLVADGADFLDLQLKTESIELLLINGIGVIRGFRAALGQQLSERQENIAARGVGLYIGRYRGLAVLGWSTNLQSSFGVTTAFRQALARRIAELAASAFA